MSGPIEDIERRVVEETLKHEVTKNKAEEALRRFNEGNDQTRRLLISYRQADIAASRKPTTP